MAHHAPTELMEFSRLQRIILWIVAVASLVTAIFLLLWAGLPERSDFIGFEVEGAGYVAPAIGETAPPIDAEMLSGSHFHLDDLRGESVIINFWATWCAPCRIEMPELEALHEETGIPVMGINIGEPREAIVRWVDEFQLSFDILLDPQQTIYRQYRVIGQPATFVVNPDGIITHIFFGTTSFDTLQSAIESHRANG